MKLTNITSYTGWRGGSTNDLGPVLRFAFFFSIKINLISSLILSLETSNYQAVTMSSKTFVFENLVIPCFHSDCFHSCQLFLNLCCKLLLISKMTNRTSVLYGYSVLLLNKAIKIKINCVMWYFFGWSSSLGVTSRGIWVETTGLWKSRWGIGPRLSLIPSLIREPVTAVHKTLFVLLKGAAVCPITDWIL